VNLFPLVGFLLHADHLLALYGYEAGIWKQGPEAK